MNRHFLLPTLLFLMPLSACSTKENHEPITANVIQSQSSTNSQLQDDFGDLPEDRKIIKEGEISFGTADIRETREAISQAVNETGAYVSKENQFDHDGKLSYKMVIRVPANRFDFLLSRLSQHADKLDRKNINLLDVTEEYVDIEARLQSKRELENRFKEILKKANTVEDILKTEKEIGAIRLEIDLIEGRLRYLKDSIAYSTLTVEFYQHSNTTFEFYSGIIQAFAKGWDILLMIMVGLAHLWSLFLLILVGVFIYRLYKRTQDKK